MKTKAVRIHGKMDLRLEEINLPEVGPDDVQVKIMSDSICMSTYKAAVEGPDHKRVPNDCAENPTIVGHEFCGVIHAVGENWKDMTEDELSSIASAFIYSMSEDERNAVVGFNMHTADSAQFIVIDMYDERSGILSRMAYTVDGGNMYTFMFSKIYDGTDIQSEWNSELNTVKFEYTPRAEEKSESKINGSLFEKVGVTLMLMAVLLFCIIVYGKIKTKK